MPPVGRIRDIETGKVYDRPSACGEDLAHLVDMPPGEPERFIYYYLLDKFPGRFEKLD